MQITLTEYEIELIHIAAKLIAERNPDLSINIMHTSGDAEQIIFEGKCAEYAFCKMFNLMPDLVADPRPGGSFDVFSRDKKKVDVKYTSFEHGRLIVPIWKKRESADIYVLMKGEIPDLRYCGFAACEDIIDQSRVKDIGHGPTYVMNELELSIKRKEG